jgi:2-oxoglutarate ferredoxin oxidoreductase subunit delta
MPGGARKREGTMQERKGKKQKPVTIQLNQKWCKGCYLCCEICPQKVFEKSATVSERGFPAVVIAHPERCTDCRQCERICPDLALDVKR